MFRAALLFAAAAGASLTACAHETVAERQLKSLEDAVNHDTAMRDREDPRLDPARIQEEEDRKLVASPSPTPPPPIPIPRVIALGARPDTPETTAGGASEPASTLNGDDINDTSPRPVIRVVGTGGIVRRGRTRDDRIEETLPDEAPEGRVGPPIQVAPPPSSALDPNARRSYDAALALVNAHDYDHALDAFAAFLVKWPDHPNADNAMYWRGECYFAKGELARAAEEFDGTIKRFPMGNKVPDCLLKLGICEQKLGNRPKAQAYFERLTREYPRSEAARRIPNERTSGRDTGRAGPEESP
jgi:tol-pal system protein YbgF